jgi:hypothetical protein
MSAPAACAVVISALISLRAAQAACTYPPEIPVPDGQTATEAQMKEAGKAVKDYMAAVESYLACLDDEEKALGDAVTDEQKNIHNARHNAAIDALNAVADRYNEQVRIFKKKQAEP